MRSLDAVEQALESAFGRLAVAEDHGLRPVEIARALRRALVDSACVGSRGTRVANSYEVVLATADRLKLAPLEAVIQGELETYLYEVAREREYSLSGRPEVRLADSSEVGPGELEIVASTVAGASQAWVQLLTGPEGGRVWDLRGQMIFGRGPAAEAVIDEASVSRSHAKIVRQGGQFSVIDLQSTNGTWVGGERVVGEAPLTDGDAIKLGHVELLFRSNAAQDS